MRGQVLIAVSALAVAAFAQPASAQQYGDAGPVQSQACQQSHNNRTLGGAAIGGVTGAIAGNNIAGRGHHGDGSILGAVVGAFVGGAIGNSTANQQPQCQGQVSGNNDQYQGQPEPGYNDGKYADSGNRSGDGYAGGDDSNLEGGPNAGYDGGK